MKIINKTDLSYEEIGKIIDMIIHSGYEDTHYVGQIQWSIVAVRFKKVQVQIRYLKRYTEWTFYYRNEKEGK